MASKNPFEEFNPIFTQYKYIEPIKYNDPLFGEKILDNGYTLNDKGDYIAPLNLQRETQKTKENLNFDYLNEMSETHLEPRQYVEEYSETYDNSPRQTNLNLKGSKKKAMDFFQSKGLSAYLAAGIVGNLMGESGLNHTAVNPTSGAYGYALWLGDRKKRLFKKYGNKPTEDLQLEFIWEELNTTEKNALNRLLRTLSVEEATNSFMKHFERPSSREMALSINKRIEFSRSLLS